MVRLPTAFRNNLLSVLKVIWITSIYSSASVHPLFKKAMLGKNHLAYHLGIVLVVFVPRLV